MSKLLEIFGRAITVDTADLIWHWLNALHKHEERENLKAHEFNEIVELLGNMDLDKAQEKLNFYLYDNPEDISARMISVAIDLHRNQLESAIKTLRTIYECQPSNTMALYSLGYCYERMGDQSEALAFYQDCIKFKSHLQLPRQRMAAIYFKEGRINKVIEEYEALIAEHPDDISSMVILGYLYINDHQFEKGIDVFNMAIVSHPDNFHEDNEDDDIRELIETGQYDRAIESVEWLMDKVGDMPDLYVKMADILSKSGRTSDAIVNYENAIRIQPNYLEATIKLGTHYLRMNSHALAAEQFNRAVEINDDIVDAYIGLAIGQEYAGHTNETYRTLSLASAIQQNSTLLFSETATLHLQSALNDKYPEDITHDKIILIEDVIKAHQKQMELTPKSADIHYKFGILMMVIGDMEKAVECFNNALEINPTHHRSRSKLAICLCETGRETEAVKRLTEHESIDNSLLDLHYRIALLYCDKRKFAEALCNLDKQMNQNYAQPDAVVNIEVVLENLGLIDRAIATWDRLTQTAKKAASNHNHE